MDYIITTDALTKQYKKAKVVNQLDLRIPEGCVYVFLGPNGAGKSTTLKMLLGLVSPTSGKMTMMGERMDERNRLHILENTGSLIESPSYYGLLSGRENL